MFNQQVSIWNSVTPQNTLSNLMDSDHFSVSKEVTFLESTRLFSSFTITDNQKRIIAQFGNEKNDPSRLIPIKDQANVVWGYYSFTTNFYKFFSPFLFALIIFAGSVFIIYFLIRRLIRSDLDSEFSRFNRFLNEIERVSANLPEIYSQKKIVLDSANFPQSIEQEIINRSVSRLFEEITKAHDLLREAILEAEQQRFQEELTRTALQVAHDVGSPLAVLEAILDAYAITLPEEVRVSVRNAMIRIRDITNSLLKKAKQDLLVTGDESLSQQLLSCLIHLVVSEKRLQYQGKSVSINFDYSASVYGLFALIKPTDFSRMLSNLINNSVEAVYEEGRISISLAESDKYAVITIEDNGKGVPEAVLANLGKLGVTHGKPNGLGMGLYHAKNTVESWGGSLQIESRIGSGTIVKIYLPKTQPPIWFVPAIKLTDKQHVIIVDDDESIHQVWRERFRQATLGSNNEVILSHIYSPDDLAAWKDAQSEIAAGVLYLCDYEFMGADENGIDVLTRLKINYLSILVTSRFNSEKVMCACEEKGIRLLPKDVARFIPIEIN